MSEQSRPQDPPAGGELSLEAAVGELDDCAIFALDADGRVMTWNAGSERIYGYQEEETFETALSVFYSDDDVRAGVPERTLEAARTRGEVKKVEQHARKDGSQFWAEVVITTLRADDDALRGFTVKVRNVTDQREREQAIRQRSVAMEASADGMAILGEEGYVYVNKAHAEIYGYDPGDLIGEHWACLYEEDERRRFEEEIMPIVRQQGSWRGEAVGKRANGETFPQEVSLTALDDGGLVCVVRDITERKERERQLQQERAFSESVLNAVPDVLYAFDEEGEFIRWNDRFSEVTGYTDAEIAEMHPRDFVPPSCAEEVWEKTEQVMQEGEHTTLESALVTSSGEHIPFEFAGTTLTDEEGEIVGRVGTGRDITERKRRDREREKRLEQQAAVTELGKRALEGPDLDALFETVTDRVAEILDVTYCSILDLQRDRNELRPRAIAGCSPKKGNVEFDPDSETAAALKSGEPVVTSDRAESSRGPTASHLPDDDARSGISVVIGSAAEPWGVFETYDTDAREFTGQDVKFVQSVATLLATAIEREQYERTLKRQRDELATLNQLHRLIEDLIQGLVEPASREELERRICEELTEATLYADAWIGTRDINSGALTQRVGTVDDGALQPFTEHATDVLEESGAETPFERDEIHVVDDFQEVSGVPAAAKRAAEERGYRAAIALPIQYGETIYGWLFVHSPRPGAFNEREQLALETLAETAGFAINAVKQERLLRTDTVTELELQATASSALFARLATECGGRCRVEEIVPATDESMLHFITVEGPAPARVRSELEAADVVRSYRMLEEQDGECRFEATVRAEEFLNRLIDAGTLVRTAVAEPGNHRVGIQASPDEDVRELVSTVRSNHPEWSVTKKETVDRSKQSSGKTGHSLEDRLTEKQLTALRTAYSAGYYASPRKSTAQEIAADLGVADSTLHQHLQTAQRKLIEECLDELVTRAISR